MSVFCICRPNLNLCERIIISLLNDSSATDLFNIHRNFHRGILTKVKMMPSPPPKIHLSQKRRFVCLFVFFLSYIWSTKTGRSWGLILPCVINDVGVEKEVGVKKEAFLFSLLNLANGCRGTMNFPASFSVTPSFLTLNSFYSSIPSGGPKDTRVTEDTGGPKTHLAITVSVPLGAQCPDLIALLQYSNLPGKHLWMSSYPSMAYDFL